MANIRLPFKPYFKKPLLDGQKTCTARTIIKGGPGDTFSAFGAQFEIVAVSTWKLGYVAKKLWQNEGCTSREHFIQVWEDIHPKKGFIPDQIVILHTFKKIGDGETNTQI